MKSIEIQKIALVKDKTFKYEPFDTPLCTSNNVAELGRKMGIHENAEEVFCVFCLNTKGYVVAFHEVLRGAIDSSLVHPREVFKRALLSNASSIILLHNHPSGESEPSCEDIKTTRRLVDAGKLLGIPVLDHIVLCDDNYTAMSLEGII